MKRFFIQLLKVIILLTGLAALFAMIRLPQTEGRAKNLDLFQIYSDPFIIYGYISSIPFFMALYKGFRLLGFVGENKLYTPEALQALLQIKYCAIACGVLIAGAGLFILSAHHKEDDPAGFFALCILMLFITTGVIIAAAKIGKDVRIKITHLNKQA